MDTGETATGRRWTFGPAVLDERSLELTVNGELTRVERKPLEVLLYLLHHAGEVVTKDDLAENLWPGRILTETVSTRCISLLRQALGDTEKNLIRTVHGFGYRLVADVRVEAAASPAPAPAFDFKPGDHPPLRTQWKLVERLGTGGHGDVWLARHDKTGDARVFKFALDSGALTSLKREITLYRLLHDSLGATAAVARVLEWNVEEPPYFIEMEYLASGNLQAWSESQGGIAAIPLQARLDLVAQIADALAAAHSVGALHKDLKPGNVLMHVENGEPSIRLCDFGSGGVLDPKRLEALGITRLGFTNTMKGATSATPLYLAPEVVAGQPFTVQADIYALGVLLYQVVAGDLRKPLAPGWEADVSDELLREDIGLAAAGNPARRLTDAAQLAERLRNVEARRTTRSAEVAAQQRAERARRAIAELRRTRVYAGALLALAAVAITGGVAAYRARNLALTATATSQAVSAFLMEDVLRIDSGLFRRSETSYEALLDRAAFQVSKRLKDQPEAAADIHWLLGRRYQEVGKFDAAIQQYESAIALFTETQGRAADPTLLAFDRLAWAYLEAGRTVEALAVAQEQRRLWESRLQPKDLAMLVVRVRIARTLMAAGDYDTAEHELRAVVDESRSANGATTDTRVLFKDWFGIEPPSDEAAAPILSAYADALLAGNILEERAAGYEEAELRLRTSLNVLSTTLGKENELSAFTQLALAVVLAARGNFTEAEEAAVRVQKFFDEWLPPGHFGRGFSKLGLGKVRFEQRRFSDALRLFKEAVSICDQSGECPARVRAEFLFETGRTHDELKHPVEAVKVLSEALHIQDGLTGPKHPYALRTRVSLADALRKINPQQAKVILSGIPEDVVQHMRVYQQLTADFRRVEGLLLLHDRRFGQASVALQESLHVLESRFGSTHWRTERAREELNMLPRQQARQLFKR